MKLEEKIKELEARRKMKLKSIEQAEKIISALQVDIIGIDGAIREFKKMLQDENK